jgi:hypothetical protein
MITINDPVLFDANILINFKGQLKFLFQFFENIIIHRQVYEEVIGQPLKDEMESISDKSKIKIVEDNFPTDYAGKSLLEECKKELKDSFNIDDLKDLGEYKTLLFAKFNNVCILSSQDTTVWRFITESKYFKGLKCITIQDFAYMLFLNASNKNDKKVSKSLYKQFTRNEHPFECFKSFMEQNNNEIPKFIEFEANRIYNFEQLIEGYRKYNEEDLVCDINDIIQIICDTANHNTNSCISCLYSRIDKNNVDYSIRKCLHDYSMGDKLCLDVRQEFTMKIRKRVRG